MQQEDTNLNPSPQSTHHMRKTCGILGPESGYLVQSSAPGTRRANTPTVHFCAFAAVYAKPQVGLLAPLVCLSGQRTTDLSTAQMCSKANKSHFFSNQNMRQQKMPGSKS